MTNQQEVESIIRMVIIILIPIAIVLFLVFGFLLFKYLKEKFQVNAKKQENDAVITNNSAGNKQSVFNFMEFDTVKDGMIIQKNGTRYLMVIECQGINYDLMSRMEKVAVEQGFVQFLNTLRHQIQIYIQTRSINLESSLEIYKEKIRNIETKLRNMQIRYEQMNESGLYSEEQRKRALYELTRQSNLYEYGKSVLEDTERMNLNKNILNKKYYIIIPYYSFEAENEKLDKMEIENIAFSELYTRSQSIIRAISPCGVRGRILKTNELIELLYMAYNRDEAETFGLNKAIRAGYNEMYSTAPDVLVKKMKELDKMIEAKALEKAQEKVNEVKTELEEQIDKKEESLEDIIADMAKLIIQENERYIGKTVKEKAVEKIEQEKKTKVKKGGKQDDEKTTTRSRKKQSTI